MDRWGGVWGCRGGRRKIKCDQNTVDRARDSRMGIYVGLGWSCEGIVTSLQVLRAE